jgi:hypothetical protein
MWLKEPLIHFLALGALIFVLYGLVGPDQPGDDEIVVTSGQQEHLVSAFSRTWQRMPTQAEFTGIVNDWIREEIAYREGLQMGLDLDDTVIRRRLRQKLEMLAEDFVAMAEPTEDVLRQYLEENASAYASEPVYTFRQVYFSADERGADTERDAGQALLLLETDSELTNPEDLGDRIALPYRLVDERESAIGARFGAAFMEALAGLEPGRWQGPIDSAYGSHLVFVEAYTPGRPRTLEEAEREVRRDWDSEQRILAIDRLYEELGSKYTITIEPLSGESAP